MSEHMILRSGYAGSKDSGTYRPMTIEEAKILTYGEHIPFMDRSGNVRTVKVNGAPKTWKRSPNRVEVPCKYGMYECATFSTTDGGPLVAGAGTMLLVAV